MELLSINFICFTAFPSSTFCAIGFFSGFLSMQRHKQTNKEIIRIKNRLLHNLMERSSAGVYQRCRDEGPLQANTAARPPVCPRAASVSAASVMYEGQVGSGREEGGSGREVGGRGQRTTCWNTPIMEEAL